MKNHILVISTWQRNEYAGFEAREYWQSESGKSWNWKKYNDTAKVYTPPTEGIKLYSQCNLDTKGDENRGMYALNVSIDGEMGMKELEQARANISRLTKIEKEYTKLCNKFGYPDTFAKFAAYIAEIIGAELAEYSTMAGDYIPTDVSNIAYKERRLTHPNE